MPSLIKLFAIPAFVGQLFVENIRMENIHTANRKHPRQKQIEVELSAEMTRQELFKIAYKMGNIRTDDAFKQLVCERCEREKIPFNARFVYFIPSS